MVKRELLDIYEKLEEREDAYKRAVKFANCLIIMGFVIFISTGIGAIPWLFEYAFNAFFEAFLGGISLSAFLIVIGAKLKRRKNIPPAPSLSQKYFMTLVDALKDLDLYFEIRSEYLKNEAVKKLSKIQRGLSDKWILSYEHPIIDLLRDKIEELRKLGKDIEEKLIPAVKQGGESHLRMSYAIMERLARFFINPSEQELTEINRLLSKLPSYRKKEGLIALLAQYPKLRDISVISLIALGSSISCYMLAYLHLISNDTAFNGAITLILGSTTIYFTLIRRSRT